MWVASFVMLLFVSEYRRFLLMYLLISLNITGLEDGEGEMKIIPALDSLIVKSNVLVVVLILLTAGMMTFAFEVTPTFADSYTLIVASDETIEWSADGSGWQPTVACWVHPSWPEIEGATWIWRTEYTDPVWEYNNVPDGGWFFRKVFTIPEDAYKIAGSIEITVDNSYNLSINEVFIGGDGTMSKDGPDSLEWKTIESFDISGALKPGENTILIRALNYYSWGSSTTNPAGIIFKTVITYCRPTVTNLIAGQHINVGTVTAWDDGVYLYVRYSTTDGWVLTETHLAVATSLDGIPQTKKGNPIPGEFPYSEEHCPPVTAYTYKIDMGEEGFEVGDMLYIAAHAVVFNLANKMNMTVVSDTDTLVTAGNVEGAIYPYNVVYAWEPFADSDPSYWDQHVDHNFSASGADWIWESYRVVHPINGDIVSFRKTFEIDEPPIAGVLYITCDNGYEVYLNGEFVGSAQLGAGWSTSDLTEPYVNTHGWQTVEKYDISDLLLPGENILEIAAANEYMGPLDNQHNGTENTNPAGLIFELTYSVPVHEETAWGAGCDFPGCNWAMYFTYTVCDS